MSGAPKVSVIVPLYNGREWIAGALGSLRDQTLRDLEVLIVDDGSQDGSVEAVKPFLEDGRFRLLPRSHAGVPATRNAGVAASRGSYLAFLDQDDLYRPRKLEVQAALLDARPELSLVHCAVERIDAEGVSLGPRLAPGRTEGRLLETFLGEGVAVPLISVLVRRGAWNEVGPLDEGLFGTDDLDWLLRAAARLDFGYAPEPLVVQRWRPGTAGQSERMYLDALALASKFAVLWPEQAALVGSYEHRARYLYGSYLLAEGRSAEARPHLAAAWRIRRTDWRAGVKWALSWLK
jgi:glycosyltransferase involved in cell wall biosynthesis